MEITDSMILDWIETHPEEFMVRAHGRDGDDSDLGALVRMDRRSPTKVSWCIRDLVRGAIAEETGVGKKEIEHIAMSHYSNGSVVRIRCSCGWFSEHVDANITLDMIEQEFNRHRGY